MSMVRSRSPNIVGAGTEEYRRVVDATFRVFGGIAIVALIARIDFARGYLAVAFPLGLLGLVLTRWLWRIHLMNSRNSGGCMSSTVVIGNVVGVEELARRCIRKPSEGYHVVGACVPGFSGRRGKVLHVEEQSIPIFGDESMIIEAINYFAADSVVVTATEQLGSEGIRQLLWILEPYDIDLIITPGVADVAGPRLLLNSGTDLALLHISKPTYSGAQRFAKSAFDVSFAVVSVLLSLPVLLVTALAIKLDSPGPVFVRTASVGLRGRPFRTFSFRTQKWKPEASVDDGRIAQRQPEATAVGQVIIKLGIDELPQLFNVLARRMSIVGPRPQRSSEFVGFGSDTRRRLLVRPGLTGLWQIAGGDTVEWEEGIRLDEYYVENWSLITDCLIILKTVRAVFRRSFGVERKVAD